MDVSDLVLAPGLLALSCGLNRQDLFPPAGQTVVKPCLVCDLEKEGLDILELWRRVFSGPVIEKVESGMSFTLPAGSSWNLTLPAGSFGDARKIFIPRTQNNLLEAVTELEIWWDLKNPTQKQVLRVDESEISQQVLQEIFGDTNDGDVQRCTAHSMLRFSGQAPWVQASAELLRVDFSTKAELSGRAFLLDFFFEEWTKGEEEGELNTNASKESFMVALLAEIGAEVDQQATRFTESLAQLGSTTESESEVQRLLDLDHLIRSTAVRFAVKWLPFVTKRRPPPIATSMPSSLTSRQRAIHECWQAWAKVANKLIERARLGVVPDVVAGQFEHSSVAIDILTALGTAPQQISAGLSFVPSSRDKTPADWFRKAPGSWYMRAQPGEAAIDPDWNMREDRAFVGGSLPVVQAGVAERKSPLALRPLKRALDATRARNNISTVEFMMRPKSAGAADSATFESPTKRARAEGDADVLMS